MRYKRYQYWTNEGLKWTDWFKDSLGNYTPKYQFEHKQLNEYKNE